MIRSRCSRSSRRISRACGACCPSGARFGPMTRRPRSPERMARPGRPRGIALVAVLLLVAGLVAIATALVTLSVSQRRAAQRMHEAEAQRERLDGALRVALAEIAFGKAE